MPLTSSCNSLTLSGYLVPTKMLRTHALFEKSIGQGVPGVVVLPYCGRINSIGLTSGILSVHFNPVKMNKVVMCGVLCVCMKN